MFFLTEILAFSIARRDHWAIFVSPSNRFPTWQLHIIAAPPIPSAIIIRFVSINQNMLILKFLCSFCRRYDSFVLCIHSYNIISHPFSAQPWVWPDFTRHCNWVIKWSKWSITILIFVCSFYLFQIEHRYVKSQLKLIRAENKFGKV